MSVGLSVDLACLVCLVCLLVYLTTGLSIDQYVGWLSIGLFVGLTCTIYMLVGWPVCSYDMSIGRLACLVYLVGRIWLMVCLFFIWLVWSV